MIIAELIGLFLFVLLGIPGMRYVLLSIRRSDILPSPAAQQQMRRIIKAKDDAKKSTLRHLSKPMTLHEITNLVNQINFKSYE